MKQIDIQITKAQIKSFSVELKDGLPEVAASVGLFTANGKEISRFSVATRGWCGTAQFELPAKMIDPIQRIAARLESIVTNECNKKLCMIKVKTETPQKQDGADLTF
jgi:hypothetical protein